VKGRGQQTREEAGSEGKRLTNKGRGWQEKGKSWMEKGKRSAKRNNVGKRGKGKGWQKGKGRGWQERNDVGRKGMMSAGKE